MGGYLVIINDTNENKCLFEIVNQIGYRDAYFVLIDAGHEGNWTWVNGDSAENKSNGGSEADTLAGGAGNDTLTGGAGKDVFIYDGQGSDIITDYKASQKDEIVLTNGKVEAVSVKGSNVIFTIGEGQITVKGGKKQKITITDADGNTTSQKYTKSTKITNFVEDDYWFAKDDNISADGFDNIINQTTYTNSAIDLTDITTDYLSINQSNKTVYQSTFTNDNK